MCIFAENFIPMKLLMVLLQFTVMTYNVENLFDTHQDEGRLFKKIHNIMQVVASADELPGLVGLCEVENDSLLTRMTTGRYARLNYGFIHFESDDPRGIDVALLYRRDMFGVDTAWQFAAMGIRRQMLYARLLSRQGRTLHVVQAHLPSRRGGAVATSHLRERCAATIHHLTDSIFATDAHAIIIVMGDMNDNPTDRSMSQSLGALPANNEPVDTLLYNICWRLQEEGRGSYYHQGEWSMLDQIIVSGAALSEFGWQAEVMDLEWLKEENGAPRRCHKGDFYNGGVSDHFPVRAIGTCSP